MMGLEERFVGTRLCALGDPGEGPAGHAAEDGAPEERIALHRPVLQRSGQGENQRAVLLGGGVKGVRRD